jgi:hypothetical protein
MSDTAACCVYMHIDALGAWHLAQVLTAMGSLTTLCFLSGLALTEDAPPTCIEI